MHIICSRSPLGERGLKFACIKNNIKIIVRSLSAWRAWIEIGNNQEKYLTIRCRSPLGERGLK